MGYCFISGKKEKGRWKFDKCDSRQTIDDAECGGGDPDIFKKGNIDRARCCQCLQYCKTHKQAIASINDWLRLHPGED